MSAKINGPQANQPLYSSQNTEYLQRSVVSSGQQKLFDTILNQTQAGGQSRIDQEINSLQQEMNSLQTSNGQSQSIDKLQATQMSQKLDPAQANPLATSTLLKLAALNSGSSRLTDYLAPLGQSYGSAIPAASKGATGATPSPQPASLQAPTGCGGLGDLCAQFESGDSGVDAIGYDSTGGTSYGTYQIASRPGTMRHFLNYLDQHAPQWAKRLRAAGPADTRSRNGAMPRVWQKIASEDPQGFEKVQHDFIEDTHYKPALEEISEKTGVDIEKQPKALQEVLWSTAVQHGPRAAANIFSKAIEEGKHVSSNRSSVQSQDLIQSVYALRSRRFGSSSYRTRSSVQRRFDEEKKIALNMLTDEQKGISATA